MAKENSKERILEAAVALLNETDNPDTITVRQIAEKTNLGIGLINYHFGSRDNLLYLAAAKQMGNIAGEFIKQSEMSGNPLEVLRDMIIRLSDYGIQNQMLNEICAKHSLLQGNFGASYFLYPLLKQIFKEEKPDQQLRFMAFEMSALFEVISLHHQFVFEFTSYNLLNKPERDQLINQIIETITGRKIQ